MNDHKNLCCSDYYAEILLPAVDLSTQDEHVVKCRWCASQWSVDPSDHHTANDEVMVHGSLLA